MEKIIVQTIINAPMKKVWEYLNSPEYISKWANASDDWGAEAKSNDVKVGGKFVTRMFAKDGSASFEFGGTYTVVEENKLLEYDMGDGRHVKSEVEEIPEGVKFVQTFDPENQNTREKQQEGWQGILNNFKKYVENN